MALKGAVVPPLSLLWPGPGTIRRSSAERTPDSTARPSSVREGTDIDSTGTAGRSGLGVVPGDGLQEAVDREEHRLRDVLGDRVTDRILRPEGGSCASRTRTQVAQPVIAEALRQRLEVAHPAIGAVRANLPQREI